MIQKRIIYLLNISEMDKKIRFEGIYGVVEVKDGKVVKKVKLVNFRVLNREVIVYM